MAATTIDEVIERLQGIVKESIAANDRMGYFAALYTRVTLAVRDGIAAGSFDDGPRMERLDVTFANRYLEAYDRYRAGELPSRAWLHAFIATASPAYIVLQHLLAGMNAHINLDLGIAAARTSPGSELAGLQGDFNRINDILASLTPLVEQEIDDCSRDFAILTSLTPHLDLKAVGAMMTEARGAAWRFALELAPLGIVDQVAVMARRDDEAVAGCEMILHQGWIAGEIRKGESEDVAANIDMLARGDLGGVGKAPAAG
jgi:hypothetical protein